MEVVVVVVVVVVVAVVAVEVLKMHLIERFLFALRFVWKC